jgi:hypothetical protein
MTPRSTRTATILSLLGAFLLSGCGPEFQPMSAIESLRVLAVQKDRPYAAPGDEVTLTMLWADGSEDSGRPVEVAWLTGCINPLGDLYAGCFATGGIPMRTDGERVSFTIPPDIITSRPPPPDPKQPPYGLSYVFFAVCAGTLEFGGADFPLRCVDVAGELLGSSDFVAGYSAIYVYDDFGNENPIVRGLSLDGRPLPSGCVDPGSAAAAESDDLGALLGRAAHAAGPPNADEPPAVCDEHFPLDPGDEPDCSLPNAPCLPPLPPGLFTRPSLEVRPEVYRSSIEADEISKAAYDRDYEEQMWVNYYTTRGGMLSDVRLLNDATTGFNDDFETLFFPPAEPGPVTLWAVVHDNRGGVSWARGTLWVQ